MINKHIFIHHLTSFFYNTSYTFVLTCRHGSTRYENSKKSCSGRNWWRNTQEISVIPLTPVPAHVHIADLNLSNIKSKVKDKLLLLVISMKDINVCLKFLYKYYIYLQLMFICSHKCKWGLPCGLIYYMGCKYIWVGLSITGTSIWFLTVYKEIEYNL